MKTKLLKVSKCTLSLVLSLMMLFSSVFVSSGVTTTATAADTPDTTAANTAQDTAQANDTSAPQKSAAPAKVTPQASGAGETYVYFANLYNWNAIYAYRWQNATASLNTSWSNKAPTTLITDPTSNYYGLYQVQVEANSKVIFCVNQTSNGTQTADISVESHLGEIWVPSSGNNNTGGSWVTPSSNFTWYVTGGLGDSWDLTQTTYAFTQDSNNSNLFYCATGKKLRELRSCTEKYFYLRKQFGSSATNSIPFRAKNEQTYRTHTNNHHLNGSDSCAGVLKEIYPNASKYTFSFAYGSANADKYVTFYIDTSGSVLNFKYELTDNSSFTYTIYYDALEESGITTPTVKIYKNGSEGTPLVAANTEMTPVDDSTASSAHKIYKYDITTTEAASNLRVKFNNVGTERTVANGHVYTSSGDSNFELADYLAEYHNEFTLYFDAEDKAWIPSVSVYKTTDSSNVYTGAMTQYNTGSASANHIYSANFVTKNAASALNVKFTGSGTNYPTTGGWAVTNNRVYNITDGATSYTNVATYVNTVYADYIYFEKPVHRYIESTQKVWGDVYAYLYNSENDKEAAWPGIKVTKVDEATGLYMYEVTGKSYAHVIFSTGTLSGTTYDKIDQTNDLDLTQDMVYTLSDENNATYNNYAAASDWYLGGYDSLIEMQQVPGEDNLLYYDTGKTISTLKTEKKSFHFIRKNGDTQVGDAISSITGTSNTQNKISGNTGNTSANQMTLAPNGYYINFENYSGDYSSSVGTVTFYLDISDVKSPKFYYEVNNVNITGYSDASTYTVYVDNSASGWDALAAYPFAKPNASGQTDIAANRLIADFPGTAMQYDTTTNLWKLTFSLVTPQENGTNIADWPKIIFTDKIKKSSTKYVNTHQTAAQALVNNKVYKIAANGNVTTYDYAGYNQLTSVNDKYYISDGTTNNEMAETTTSGVYKYSTGKTIAQLTGDEFYILEESEKGNIKHRRSSTLELGQFEANDKLETYERVIGNFKFNDSSVTQGNVDLYYQPSTGLFWYEFASTPTTYTVSASSSDSGLTASLIGFSSKKYIAGSTATIRISNIPQGKAVNTVMAGSNTLTPNENDEYTFAVNAATTVTVTLRDKYIINVTMASNPAGAGTVKASKTSFTEGEKIKITAITGVSDDYDYTFTGWTATNGALKFADGYTATSTSAMVTPKVTTAPASGNVVTITITANYTGTALENVTENGTSYYISYGVEKNIPTGYNHSKRLKQLTVNGETKYFVDFVKDDFLMDNSTDSYGSYINFSLSTNSTPSAYTSFVGQHKDKKVTLVNSSIAAGNTANTNVNNESEATYFCQMTSVKWDAILSVRLYVDGLEGGTEQKSGNSYKIDPTYEAVEKAAQVQNVKFYLKNGTVRESYEKYSQLATSSVTNAGTDGITITSNNAYRSTTKIGYGPVGSTVQIKTEINNDYVNKYYVKAFCVNGISYNVIDEPASGDARRLKSSNAGYDAATSGVYTFNYTLPANTDSVEITPIYYYFTDDSSDNKVTINGKQQTMEFFTFYVEDFSGAVKDKWGSTIAVQAWYTGDAADETTTASNNNKNCLGGFPGQPMIFADGESRYYMQIPKYREDGKSVQGVTMNNYVWDDVHAKAEWGINNTDSKAREKKNCQTYDYDDFAAIANFGAEKIFFTFKYRTNTNNPSYNADVLNPSIYGNSWNALVDHGNRGVDLFGNRIKKTDTVAGGSGTYSDKDTGTALLSEDSSYLTEAFIESDKCDNKIYVTSDGYVDYESNNNYKYLGKYATKWTIYRRTGTTGNYTFTKLGALPSSAFVPNVTEYKEKENDPGKIDRDDADNKALFLSYSSTSSIARNTEWKEFCDLYDACKNYPAVITYEEAIIQSDQPALRNDGRWYYSKESERIDDPELYNIVGNIIIEYKAKGTTGFTPDEYSETTVNGKIVYTGEMTHAQPKFTDTDKYVDTAKSSQIKEVTKIIDGTSYNFSSEESTTYTYDDNGTQKTRTFVFVGWFMKNDNIYTEVNPTDIAKSTGSTPRISSETFVARYEEVEGKTLFVNHTTGTYSGENKGTGKTYSVVKIFRDGEETPFVNERSEGLITITSKDLDDNNKIEISIEAVADTTSRYATTTQSIDGAAATIITNTMTGSVGDPSASKTIVSSTTTTVSSLFNSAEVKKYEFVSTFSLATFKVVYCFYDRATTQNAKIDIKTTPTAVPVRVPYSATDTISQIIWNGLNETVENGDGTMNKLGNILDKYYIWTTQTGTEGAEAGIAALDDISAEKDNGSYQKYGTTKSSDDLKKHFDSLGKPITVKANPSTATDTNNWVNYKVNGSYVTSISGELAESEYTPANTNATEVVVWAYNTPRTYSVKFIYPVAVDNEGNAGTQENNPYNIVNTEHIVKNDKLINNNSVDNNNPKVDVYSYDYTVNDMNDGKTQGNTNTINTNNSRGATVFYGQRFGSIFTESVTINQGNGNEQTIKISMNNDGNIIYADGDNANQAITGDTLTAVYSALDERDKPGTHIANYGVKLGFTNEKIVVVKEFDKDINNDGTPEKLVFDGWYDASTGAKITSTYDYGYRVTSDVVLIAGYRVSTVDVTTTPKATVSADEFDFYFVSNANGNDTSITERMRFNTQLNVYDSADSNSDIKQIGAAYIQLRVDGEGTEFTTLSACKLAQDPKFIEALRQEILKTLSNVNYDKGNDVVDVIPNGTTRTNTQWLKYKEKWVAWKMIYTYDTQYGTGQGNTKQVDLNTKNRAIFTMDIQAEKYDENNKFSAVLVYGAMKVNDNWVVSDNCVKYINCDAPAEVTMTGGNTPVASGSSYEGSVEDTSKEETP